MELFTAQQIQSLNELELLVYRYINEHPQHGAFHAHPRVGPRGHRTGDGAGR